MSAIEIRKGTAADAELITDLIKKMVLEMAQIGGHAVDETPNTWSSIKAHVGENTTHPDHLYLLAAQRLQQEVILGMAAANLMPLEDIFWNKRCLHLSAIYTIPDARRQGIASQLIKQVLGWGQQMEADEVDLNVLVANPARHLYEKLGFKPHEISMVKKITGNMDKAAFLTILKGERSRFEALLTACGLERMEIPGVSGHYTLKDIVAHLDAYLQALVTWLKEARAGRVYVDPLVDQPDLEARNALIYENNKDREPSEVVQRFSQTWDELENWVGTLTRDELNNANQTAWFVVPRWHRAQSLWRCIANDSYEHQGQHIPDIERWLKEQGHCG